MKQNVYDYSYEMRRKRRNRITLILAIIISVIVFISLFMNIVLFPVHVNSDTMDSDIPRGSAVFVSPLLRSPKRGDVVYLSRMDNEKTLLPQQIANTICEFFTLRKYYPFGYTKRMTGKPMLRRVLALPGDTIYMRDYVLYVRPANSNLYLTEFELASRPYNIHIYSVPAEWDGMGSCGTVEEHTLGEDEYFVLCDNRIEGTDSRLWGSIQGSSIKGSAVLEYFPFNKFRVF